jgi:hypothetical protein
MTRRYMLLLISTIVVAFVMPARAQVDPSRINQELAASNQSVIEGHIQKAVEGLRNLLSGIDPTKDKDAYWRTSSLLIEILSETENHILASQVISALIATKIPEGTLLITSGHSSSLVETSPIRGIQTQEQRSSAH